MSLNTGYTWTYKNIRLVGYSIGGTTTSVTWPDADVCFDVGQGLPFQIPIANILLTHGHMDHASGLPYLISQKSMQSQPRPKVYMPSSLIKPMRDIMNIWAGIDEFKYEIDFRIPKPDEEYSLTGAYFFKTAPSFHRVQSQGYTVFERKKRLKEEYRELDPASLGQLRSRGTQLDEHYNDNILSFSGDTTIEFLDSPQVRQSRVIVMEVTYWDKKKTVANAREWGHIHLDELIPRLDSLRCERLLLIHASARYSSKDLQAIIEDRVPEHWKDRLSFFPRPN